MLGPSALSSLETAGDNDRCPGRTAGPAEHLAHGRTGGLWTPSLLVEAGVTARVLRRKMDRAGQKEDGQGRLAIHLRDGRTATDRRRKQKMCEVRPRPGRRAEAHCPSETHMGLTGLKGEKE